MNEHKEELKDQGYHFARVDIATQGARALLLINGGAAVALLGFLSSIWGEANVKAALDSILCGIILLSFGVLFAASNFFFRYWTSRSRQHKWTNSFRIFLFLEWASIIASLAAFPIAIFILSTGIKEAIL